MDAQEVLNWPFIWEVFSVGDAPQAPPTSSTVECVECLFIKRIERESIQTSES